MKTLPNKIVIVSLCEKFSNEIACSISQDLGMLFCCAEDLIEYELIDRKMVEEVASVKYIEKVEKKVLKNLSTYENVLIGMSYLHLLSCQKDLKNSSYVIFLDLPKNFVKENDKISFLDYEYRKNTLQTFADLTISVKKLEKDFIKEKILKTLGGLL